MFNGKAFHDRDMTASGSIPISSKDGWMQKNLHLELALNVTKLAIGQKNLAFHLHCCQESIQTVDMQDPGKLIPCFA